MAPVGALRKTAQGYALTAPTHCHHGHALGRGEVSVAHEPCDAVDGGHTSWRCNECGDVTRWPPEGPACRLLNGPATVRNL